MGARLVSIKAQDNAQNKVRPIIEQTRNGDLLCYESTTGRWFRSSEKAVRSSIDLLNGITTDDNKSYIGVDTLLNCLDLYGTVDQRYGWRLHTIPFDMNLFKIKIYQNGFQDMEEPVLVIYSTIPAIRDYDKEEV